MKKLIGIGALIALAGMLVAARTSTDAEKAKTTANPAIARGKYLVGILGCNDCHTPKKMTPNGPVADMTKELAGHVAGTMPPPPAASGPWIAHTNSDLTAWAGPWGVSFARNLTPEENTGIGSWSEETFIKSIRTGKHMGVSRPILPPMPWQDYGRMTDADLKAVYAYLRSIKPIVSATPEPIPPAGMHP